MKDRERQAARWLMCAPRQREAMPEFAAWIADPENRRLFDEMARIWDGIADAPGLETLPLPAPRRISRRQMLAGGAGVAVAAGAAGFALLPEPGGLRTGRGERRVAALGPGREVTLDAASRASFAPEAGVFRLTEGRAQLRIDRTGAALEVALPAAQLRLGEGVFDLHLLGARTELSVLEGAARVLQADAAVATLAPREKAVLSAAGGLRMAPADTAEAMAWTQGRAVFEDSPLPDVIADLDRYLPGKVVLRGSRAAALRVTGSYPTDRPEQGLDGIVAALGLARSGVGPWLVILSA